MNNTLEKQSRINWDGNKEEMSTLEAGLQKKAGFVGCITLQEGLNMDVAMDQPKDEMHKAADLILSLQNSQKIWKDYWNKSGVKLADQFLERMW